MKYYYYKNPVTELVEDLIVVKGKYVVTEYWKDHRHTKWTKWVKYQGAKPHLWEKIHFNEPAAVQKLSKKEFLMKLLE